MYIIPPPPPLRQETKEKVQKKREEEKQLAREHNKIEQQLRREGKRPFYIKKCEHCDSFQTEVQICYLPLPVGSCAEVQTYVLPWQGVNRPTLGRTYPDVHASVLLSISLPSPTFEEFWLPIVCTA